MIHLTITGMYAGAPFCGIDKVEAKELGDRFIHGMYFPFDNAELAADLCSDCKRIWDSADDED